VTTKIYITPPGEAEQELIVYDSCTTSMSATDRAGSISINSNSKNSDDFDAFTVGSDIRVVQDGNTSRGWILNPPRNIDGQRNNIQIQGISYAARTQKIIVTESYTNAAIGDIVTDLFTKYVPWATRVNIQSCSKIITIRFGDNYLWDAMEQLCQISTYDWYIDEDLDVNFFDRSVRLNPIVLSQASKNYKRGSANLTPDASKLVNKLWVKGGKATSDPYTQAITVSGTTPIPIFYTPVAMAGTDVTVVIGGVAKTVGIQNVDKVGTKHFLLNVAEKLLIPDLLTTGTGTIVYSYEYPIKILLEEPVSQAQYGIFEDILETKTDDKILATELGLKHLYKYSQPVISGSISPFSGTFKAGETIKVEIPRLRIDSELLIKDVMLSSIPKKLVDITLNLETPERDLPSIIKDLKLRLSKLEKTIFNDTDGPIEKYVALSDAVVTPTFVDDGLTWFLHQYWICGQLEDEFMLPWHPPSEITCSEERII